MLLKLKFLYRMKSVIEPPSEIQQIFDQVLKKITPSKDEIAHFLQVESDLIKIIQESSIPSEIEIRYIEAEGSTGIKQTSLRDAADIDMFIVIDPKIIFEKGFDSKGKSREYLRALFKRLVQDWLMPTFRKNNISEIELSYAEHPYLSAKYKGIDLDIVIAFDLEADFLAKNGPITAVDRTPHHSRFIRDALSLDQRNDVRLFKHFLKCHHCYGDKSPVGRSGFIGYSAEILIAHFGSLWNLFQNFQILSQEPISIYHKRNNKQILQNEISFRDYRSEFYPNDFLVILDPTDIKRNVGSSISERAYWCIESNIAQFLQKPSPTFFEKSKIPNIGDLNLTYEEKSKYFYVEYHQVKEDHYTKFRDKLYSFLEQICRDATKELTLEPRFENIIGELLFEADEGNYCIALRVEQPTLSQEFVRKGPKIGDEPHFSKFKKKYHTSYVKEGYLWVILPRPFWEFRKYLDFTVKEKKIDNLECVNFGNATDAEISDFAERSIGNLHLNVVPFQNKYKN